MTTVREATHLVGRPIFFSMAIILLAFLPVFALTGQEGKLFHPLAFTKTCAVLGATLLAVTLVPVLCSLLLGGRMHGEGAHPCCGRLPGLSPVASLGVATPRPHAERRRSGVCGSGRSYQHGREFMPPSTRAT